MQNWVKHMHNWTCQFFSITVLQIQQTDFWKVLPVGYLQYLPVVKWSKIYACTSNSANIKITTLCYQYPTTQFIYKIESCFLACQQKTYCSGNLQKCTQRFRGHWPYWHSQPLGVLACLRRDRGENAVAEDQPKTGDPLYSLLQKTIVDFKTSRWQCVFTHHTAEIVFHTAEHTMK